MMLKKVGAYHSVRAHHRGGVYHDRSDCATGRQLHSQNLSAGTWGLPLCDLCRVLAQQDMGLAAS